MLTLFVFIIAVVVVTLVSQAVKVTRDQGQLWLRLYSLSLAPGWIYLKGEDGVTQIQGGTVTLETPHGRRGPSLSITTVPGTLKQYPYPRSDGTETVAQVAVAAGFDITLTTPTLPDMPLPPRVHLEFRDDTLTIRTWHAKVVNAE